MERILFSNYPEDIEASYSNEEVLEYMGSYGSLKGYVAEKQRKPVESVTQQDINDVIYETKQFWVEDSLSVCQVELLNFFGTKNKVLFAGSVGRWNGNFGGGDIGEFEDLYYKALKDCDYVKVYDNNGHLYITGSHHDGTNSFEVKVLTDKGEEYYENWNYGYSSRLDNLSEQEILKNIYERYSRLPNYYKTMYN